MKNISPLFKTLLVVGAMSATLVACERRNPDQSGAQSSGDSAVTSGERSSGASEPSGTYSGSATGQRAGRTIDDSLITTKAKTALLADTTVKGSEIHVETDKGVVSLSGAVETEMQRDRAVSIVRGIDGVKGVDNKVTLKQ